MATPHIIDVNLLRQQAHWIRDVLEPRVAQAGPDSLHPDDVLSIDEFLRTLIHSNPSIEDLRSSHIHLALLELEGTATRWPSKLVEKCETLVEIWEKRYGPLRKLNAIFELGGRLYGVCESKDLALSQSQLLSRWMGEPGSTNQFSPLRSRRHGHLAFNPGDWWLNALFAYRDGIIDNYNPNGGPVLDSDGVYAIVLSGRDENASDSPEKFEYLARNTDNSRHRLTSARPASRNPVRILRSHRLISEWKPRAGLRYDGLYVVTGWSIGREPTSDNVVYKIRFDRLASESNIDGVLERPWANEMDDYDEWKRLREEFVPRINQRQ